MFINTRGKSEKSQTDLKKFMNKGSSKLFRGKIYISRLLDYSTNFYIIILIAFALVFPSYSSSVFSGIPLNTKVEFFVFLFLISFLLGLILIKKLNFMFNKRIIIFFIAIVMVILLKIFLFVQTTGHPEGFEACYRSIINKLPDGQCEFSFDHFLKSNKNFTRYDEIIDFDSDWKLGFWNELRFNFYQWVEGNQIRKRNPFEVTWRGNVLIPSDPEAKLSIEYTGEGKIQLGNNTVFLPTNYQSKNTFLIDINEVLSKDIIKRNDELILPIKIYYKFQDFSKVGMDKSKLGPNSNLKVLLITENGKTNHLRSYFVKDFKSKSLSMLLDSIIILLILFIIISHLILLYKENKFLFIVYLLGGVIILLNSQYKPLINFVHSAFKTSVFFLIVVSIASFARKKKEISYFFISFLFLTQLFIHINADLEKVIYRIPGDDPMTYESLSRTISKAENISDFIRGGEEIFYYQPFIRYYLAFNHILLGDGVLGVSIFNKFLFLFTIPFIFLFFSRRLKFIPALIFSLAFMNIFYNFIFYLIDFGLSEYPAWLFLIIAIYLLFFNRSNLGYFIGFALLGFAAITRTNFLPGIFYLIFVFYIYYSFYSYGYKVRGKKYRYILISFLIFVVIYSLVPVHNYYFGNKLVLTTHSVISLSLKLPPSKLLHIFSDEKVKQQVLSRLNLLFYLDWKSFSDKSFYTPKNFRFFLNLFLFLLSVSFLFNIGRLGKIITAQKIVKKKETIMNLLFILVPLSFLFLHLFVEIKVYYPRHIVIGHIMIYLFSVYSSSSLINWFCKKFEKMILLFKRKI